MSILTLLFFLCRVNYFTYIMLYLIPSLCQLTRTINNTGSILVCRKLPATTRIHVFIVKNMFSV